MKKLLLLVAVVALIAVAAPTARADVFTLANANSIFTVNTDYSPFQWIVDGRSELYQQGFWWRIGDRGPEYRLGPLFTSVELQTPRVVILHYDGDPRFKADVTYSLVGGDAGSHVSDVNEQIFISHAPSDMKFFQYSDFDLGGTQTGDRDLLNFPNGNAVDQHDLNGTSMFSETVVTPPAAHHEGSLYPALIASLDDADPTTLSDLPAVGGGSISGDVAWAFQWDVNRTILISKDKHLSQVPEPGTLLLLGLSLGIGSLVTFRRRQK